MSPARSLLAAAGASAVIASILVLSAGRWDIPWLWAYVAVIAATFTVLPRVIDPGLLRERLRPAAGGVDRHLRVLMMPVFLAHLVIAGLDAGRFHWSGDVPVTVRLIGAAGLIGMFLVALWTIRTNRFFSPVVRIQHERGHHVISTGPYRWIRHPGYAITIVGFPFGSLLMGSYWSALPHVVAAALMLRRTLIEDRYLHEHLEGYVEYAQRVRYRLLPGVW